ncbi:Polar tube protein 1 [Nosema bombycis CQ1]|uniref:Polar tube protein 1 n=1 Tax=Nosema bombycis (strain CQ1 / CVCC 102059) TaxID=578461 RepID=R0MQM8_NOSB1|nr:Polar tube protein 1 [Nosema bombycis CQ1]|eukprot:EOB15198.1 Polar tube protein 1 [Nosema bombycis CQ1]
MRIRSFKLLSLVAYIKLNSANMACSPGNGTPVVAITQPGGVENCATTSPAPLVYESSNGQNPLNNFTPDCLVNSPGVPVQSYPVIGVPVSGTPGTPGAPGTAGNNYGPTECVPTSGGGSYPPGYFNPPMATTIINPPTYAPPGTPGSPSANNPPAGFHAPPPAGPPAKNEEQCTVTTKLDCEPVSPGVPAVTAPPAGPPIESVGVPPQKVALVTPVASVASVVAVPPSHATGSGVPCIPVSSTGGHPSNLVGGGFPSNAQVTQAPCVPSQAHHPVASVPVTSVPVNAVPMTSAPVTPLGPSYYGSSSLPPSGSHPTAPCGAPQNALSSPCATNNASAGNTYTSSNVGAACSLPNAENCLMKALENVGRPSPQEAASCVTAQKQPMVEIGMMLPVTDAYSNAANNPCVLN